MTPPDDARNAADRSAETVSGDVPAPSAATTRTSRGERPPCGLVNPVSRQLMVNGRRTTLRVEAEIMAAVLEICVIEGVGLPDLCSELERRHPDCTLTSAVRVYTVSYFRAPSQRRGRGGGGRRRTSLKPLP